MSKFLAKLYNFKYFNIVFSIFLMITILFAGLGIFSYFKQNDSSSKAQIYVSIYPLYTLLKDTSENDKGNSNLNIELLAGANSDPHLYEPTPSDLRKVLDADFFIYVGQVDFWAQDLARQAKDKGVEVIEVVDYMDLENYGPNSGKESVEDKEESHDEEHDEEHDDENGNEEDVFDDHEDEDENQEDHSDDHDQEHTDSHSLDDHFWLDPVVSQKFIAKFYSDFGQDIDAFYDRSYESKLGDLNNQYSQELSLTKCRLNQVVVSHSAFDYLGDLYGFEIESVAGAEPSNQPSPARVAELIGVIKENKIQYVLLESSLEERIYNPIIAETQVEILSINSMEGGSLNDNYLEIMQDNLETLQKAMDC